MRISVIICTFGRAAVLRSLLDSLNAQTYRNFETLVIDGNAEGNASPGGESSLALHAVQSFTRCLEATIQVDVIAARKGLTHQRNIGLDHATGELICFLDDDVTLPSDFLQRINDIFERPDFRDVGGLTGYDALNFPVPITLRWRLRRLLRVIPDLPPGGVDRFGRGIPVGFLSPFTGFKEVGLLPGFCMVYRRSAIGNLRFDELIPTYAGEDRDFSMQVGMRSRLLICGDLHLQHHASPQGRDSDRARNFQSAFGMGRRFAKYSRGGLDNFTMVSTFTGDLLIDLMFLLRRPSLATLQTIFVRVKGFFVGLRSKITPQTQVPLVRRADISEAPREGATTVR